MLYNLEDYMGNSLLSSVYCTFVVISICFIADSAGIYFFKRTTVYARALYFFTGLLLLSWLSFIVGICHVAYPVVYRCIGGILSVSFLVLLWVKRPSYKPAIRTIKDKVLIGRVGDKALGIAIALCLLLLFLVSLSPPTDADSLNYHLALPVQILNMHGLHFSPCILHFRLFGYGEMLNVFGVANGCPQFGALTQLVGLGWLLAALCSGQSSSNKLIVTTAILGLPLLLFFIPGQKNQLTGICCTSLCFYIIAFHKEELSSALAPLIFACILFACGIKYSFLISAFALLVLVVLKKGRGNNIPLFTTVILLAIVFLAPLYVFKALHFGDPVSPLLEKLKAHPDRVVTDFGDMLKNYTEAKYPFPLSLVLPTGAGAIASVLGFGFFVILVSFLFFKQNKAEIIAISVFIVLTIAWGQKTARFFTEPFLWSLPVTLAGLQRWKYGKLFWLFSKVQFLLLLPFWVFACYVLAPAAFSNGMRQKVLSQCAYGYDESKWIEEVLPPGKPIVINITSRAYLKRPYFPMEYWLASPPVSVAAMDSLLDLFHVEYLVLYTENTHKILLTSFAGKVVAGPEKFRVATRNPFNTAYYYITIFERKKPADY